MTGPSVRERALVVCAGFFLIAGIGIVDYLTGSELAFSVFYVIPIYIITWKTNQRLGLAASASSAVVWSIADMMLSTSYSSPLIPVWNTLIRLSFFVLIASLLSSVKKSLQLAHTDHLTSAVNARRFHELARMEIQRSQRYQHPFTIAYIDLDNFKEVNDRFGHLAGDEVLCGVVKSIRSVTRQTDVVARLGGDEFVVLFPETDETAARTICCKIRDSFLEEMTTSGREVTMSMGVVTCQVPPDSAEELIRMADNLMYSAKADGSNTIKYSSHTS